MIGGSETGSETGGGGTKDDELYQQDKNVRLLDDGKRSFLPVPEGPTCRYIPMSSSPCPPWHAFTF